MTPLTNGSGGFPGGWGSRPLWPSPGFRPSAVLRWPPRPPWARSSSRKCGGFNYAPRLAGGHRGRRARPSIFLIPPSIGFVVYGMLTEQSIGKLLIAGMLPGLLLSPGFSAHYRRLGEDQPGHRPRAAGEGHLQGEDPGLERHLGDRCSSSSSSSAGCTSAS